MMPGEGADSFASDTGQSGVPEPGRCEQDRQEGRVVREACAVQSLVHHRRLAVEKMDEAKKLAEKCGMVLHLPPPYPLTLDDMKKPTMSREEARDQVIEREATPSDLGDNLDSAKVSEESLPQSKTHIPSPEKFRAWNARILPGGTVSCPYAWRETWVHHEGTVFCCDTNNFPHPMGAVPKERITKIWNGEKYRRLRERLIDGEVYAACRHCHVMGQIEHPEDPLSFVKEA